MSKKPKFCQYEPCGKPISNDGTTRKYCNDRCFQDEMNKRLRERNKAKAKKIDHKCPHCGKKWTDTNPKKIYCDKDCDEAFNAQRIKATKQKHYAKVKAKRDALKKTIVCKLPSCDKEFVQNYGRLYCCDEHRDENNKGDRRVKYNQPFKTFVCDHDGCNNSWRGRTSRKKYCNLDSCSSNNKQITIQPVPVKMPVSVCSKPVPKKQKVKKSEQKRVPKVTAKTERKPKVVIDISPKDKKPEMALPESVINDSSLDGIPTIDGMPKRVRKDRKKEVVAPRDGTYGENDQKMIAEALARMNKG